MKIMTPNSSYLLRAYYDWITDNQLTPYIVVDTSIDGVHVPSQFIEDDQIILNVAFSAIRLLEISPECVSFQARFQGVTFDIWLPIHAITAIYAQENGVGFTFVHEEFMQPQTNDLELLDDDKSGVAAEAREQVDLTVHHSSAPTEQETADVASLSAAKKAKKGSHLKVIK
jgi:stringent starvation protein B